MKELLHLFPRPSHYLGNEINSIHKDIKHISVHIALAFPDLYDVAMSYLGQRILYNTINEVPNYWAERVFTPSHEVAKLLQKNKIPLASLESDTALSKMDIIAFSLTHELCYTNILYMLDLANIPLRACERTSVFPLIICGGGVAYNPEPIVDFFDVCVLGDGEIVMNQIAEIVAIAKKDKITKQELLLRLKNLPGIYIPSFFEVTKNNVLRPLYDDYQKVDRVAVVDIDKVGFPTGQIPAYGKPVHDRLIFEIARGCTRGCRFCQAGMVYRPVRERKVDKLCEMIAEGIQKTGFEETSFLSLSTGDFSGLESLFFNSLPVCQQQKVAIALPSLRAGSVSSALMSAIKGIKRTGLTIAPEAGSQRLRDVINKGINEQDVLNHVRTAIEHGWRSVKLYFMIDLPTETDQDLQDILELCLKIAKCGGRSFQVTAAISPFIPKPQTPFQWHKQANSNIIEDKINFLRMEFKKYKQLHLRWHHSHSSFLEGVFSRGDRALSASIERAYGLGAIFTSWTESLNFDLWLEAFADMKIDPLKYFKARDLDEVLPWDHLNSGVTKQFLQKEYERAIKEEITVDCRYDNCSACGACVIPSKPEIDSNLCNRLNFSYRDQQAKYLETIAELPTDDRFRYLLRFSKIGVARYLSQLEIVKIFEQALRRSELAVNFSQGFHPKPQISFGRASSVGIASESEICHIVFNLEYENTEILEKLKDKFPIGMEIKEVSSIPKNQKIQDAMQEVYIFKFDNTIVLKDFLNALGVAIENELVIEKNTKSGAKKTASCADLIENIFLEKYLNIKIIFKWEKMYCNPLLILSTIFEQYQSIVIIKKY